MVPYFLGCFSDHPSEEVCANYLDFESDIIILRLYIVYKAPYIFPGIFRLHFFFFKYSS